MIRPICPFCSISYSCEKNAHSPKGNPKTGRFPELGEEVSGWRRCPVCDRYFDKDLKEHTPEPKVVDNTKKGDGDPSNPGNYIDRTKVSRGFGGIK